MEMLMSLFGSFALLAIVFSALVLIVAPAYGREMLKNTASSIGLVFIGLVLLQVCCASLHR